MHSLQMLIFKYWFWFRKQSVQSLPACIIYNMDFASGQEREVTPPERQNHLAQHCKKKNLYFCQHSMNNNSCMINVQNNFLT